MAPMSRFQFSLRTLLVATTIIAGPCTWVAYNANLVRQRKAIRSRIGIPGYCFLDGSLGPGPGHPLPWLRRALGDEPVERLVYIANRDPDGSELRRARAWLPETEIQEIRVARHRPGEPYKVFVRTGRSNCQ
jgi:hypothetical protein